MIGLSAPPLSRTGNPMTQYNMIRKSSEGPEPIAIVGIGCRMPGDIRSPPDLWRLLMSKGIANMAKVPKSRFNIDAYLHSNNDRPGSFHIPGGYFLDGEPEDFDPGMFNISPVEAMWMDPQQRKLLEVIYEAFESCGTTLDEVAGTRTGCFIGSFATDFQQMAHKEPDFRHMYVATGVDVGILGNRISHVFDLRGPSLMINTACSASLYALDLACKSMASGECDGAIVGGVNIILTVDQHMNTAKMGVLSPTNQSHTFDEAADGYGRAEGVGALYLKPLSAAIQNGDPIRAVIRGTATTCSGRPKDGMSHPSSDGQVDVISLAYKYANLSPNQTTYVECHGTGTQVGDPIEVDAIHKAMGVTRPRDSPVLIGSVKPNVGHSEAASSMGTLIKTILALENGMILPTTGINKLNPAIPWENLNVKVVTEPTFFPRSAPLHRIGVNAFGYGGTNAHAILESAKSFLPLDYRCHKFISHLEGVPNGASHTEFDAGRAHLLLLSAHDEPTLKSNIDGISTKCQDANLLDLAYTLGLRRTKFKKRAFAVCNEKTFQSDMNATCTSICQAPDKTGTPAFVFTGQGAQWARMGATLLDLFPCVLQTIRGLDYHLSTLKEAPRWKIEEVLLESEETSVINEPEYSQPLCTAVQIVLVDMMSHWGVKPVATIGHSSGEIGAAYAAGRISAESAITAAYFRGKVAASLRTDGAMLAVGLGRNDVTNYLNSNTFSDQVVVACDNSPNSTTLSGDREAIEQLKQVFDNDKIFARIVKTGGKAYHSHHMKDAATKYEEYLQNETLPTVVKLPVLPMFSTVRATRMGDHGEEVPNSYWVENLNSPVLFNQGVKAMLSEVPDINVLIEIGPHPALTGPLRQICQTMNNPCVSFLSTLKRKEHDGDQMLRLAGNLWAKDVPLDVAAVTSVEKMSKSGSVERHSGSFLVDLPTYHWNYSKVWWAESRMSKEHRQMIEPRHDILGRRILGTSALEPSWRNILRQKDLPWLSQHRVGGEVMLPGAGYLALAIEAITQVNAQSKEPLTIQSYTMRDVIISSATVVPDDDEGTETIFRLQPTESSLDISNNGVSSQWYEFNVSCCSYGAWKETARGRIAINIKGRGNEYKPHSLPKTPHGADYIPWLDKLRSLGFDLGPAFHHINRIYTDGKTHTARSDMKIHKECGLVESESRYVLHPTVLDACIQTFLAAVHLGHIDSMHCATIPTHFGEATLFPPSPEHLANKCVLQAWVPQVGNRAYTANSQLIAHDGSLLADLSGCRSLLYGAAVPQNMRGNLQKDLYIKVGWKIDADYLSWAKEGGVLSDRSLETVLDVFHHKDAATRVLCFDESLIPRVLEAQPDFNITFAAPDKKALEAFTSNYTGEEAPSAFNIDANTLEGTNDLGDFGIIVSTRLMPGNPEMLEQIRSIMTTGSRLLLQTTGGAEKWWDIILRSLGYSGVDEMLAEGLVITSAVDAILTPNGAHAPSDQGVVLIYKNTPSSLLSVVSRKLIDEGRHVHCQPIDSLDSVAGKQVIILADTEGPLLAHLNGVQLQGLIRITENTNTVTWVTCGGLLSADHPEYAMTGGAARVLRQEKGSLDLVTLDYDSESTSEHRVAALISDIIERQHINGRNGETEYCIKGGVVYVSRLVSHRSVNREFVPESGEMITLHQSDSPALHAQFKNGSLVFHRNDESIENPLDPEQVEVHVTSIGLGLSDGADDTTFLNHEMFGEVVRVGENVENVSPGDNVIGFALDSLSTFQRTLCQLVQPIAATITPTQIATIPSAYCTAIYGLEELSRIEEGDTVIIVDGMGAIGQAAIHLCDVLKANAIVVTSSKTTRDFLQSQNILSAERIISGIDADLSAKIDTALGGVGVDIIMCSTSTNEAIIAECSRSLAPFGKIVSVGLTKAGTHTLQGLCSSAKSISSFQFELADLIERRPRLVARLLKRCTDLLQSGRIGPILPCLVKEPSQATVAVQSIPSDLGAGKTVLTYDKSVSFKALASQLPLRLKSDVTYLLIGCLGGLGRQVALWMADRGARHLAFVSRSGSDNPAAAEIIRKLESYGVEAVALRADVTRQDELFHAICQINSDYPICGVVNAANIMRDGLFRNMTIEQWQECADTKVKGCLNLHEIFKDDELDFFVMTSSVSSTLGSSGQSNYSAANAVLDSLARHRHTRGLPAVSLILPAIFGIGYIAEHPEIEQSIRSKGMYGISEKEMLEAFEIAMTPQSLLPAEMDHLVVGIQPRPYGRAIKAAGAYIPWEEDPRLNWMALAVKQQADDGATGPEVGEGGTQSLIAMIKQGMAGVQLHEAVTTNITRRLARLLMLEESSVDAKQKSVASHGLDSMIGAEFRNWIFREFKVDVPFQQLLAGSLTISELARLLCDRVSEEKS